ncbi:MAG: hypothetical protein LBF78_07500 [Treponema sp.]|jgi:hypothetical protein|nr:hypothetical protein [Treponema sp.]
MKENIFDFDVMARGSFIDDVTGPFKIEAITLRLNHVALDEYNDSLGHNAPECYNTHEEWMQYRARKDGELAAWEKKVIDMLGLYREQGKTGVVITQANSEVFTVVFIKRIAELQSEEEYEATNRADIKGTLENLDSLEGQSMKEETVVVQWDTSTVKKRSNLL